MKVATYNVNGVNGRLPVLLRWLKEAQPDIVCLQELKAPQEKFPLSDIQKAGYGAIWHGQKSWNGVAILAQGSDPVETRRGLPGDPEDLQSRYLEATIKGLTIGCLYLPNGNPAPGPKFDYKLAWFGRLQKHAKKLLASGEPVILAGDYNVMPTELDVYKPERWLDDALFRPEVRGSYKKIVDQGWTDALRKLHRGERIYTFWDYFRNAYARDAGLRIDHFLLSPAVAKRLVAADVDREVRGWEKTSDHAPVWIELCEWKIQTREGSKKSGALMARKLKTFVTTGGFYELAVAAPSMKAAAKLLGVKSNAFSQGFAYEADDAAIKAATMEQPGVLLRRAVGTKGRFAESADLPKLSALEGAMKQKRAVEPRHAPAIAKKQRAAKPKEADTAASRKAAELYDLAEKRREREERQATAKLEKERERQERATEKAQAALDEARSRHKEQAADIKKQRDALDRKARLEDEHWDDEERKLKAALRRAEED